MVLGKPAARAAARALYGAKPSLTLPQQMSSTRLGLMLEPVRVC